MLYPPQDGNATKWKFALEMNAVVVGGMVFIWVKQPQKEEYARLIIVLVGAINKIIHFHMNDSRYPAWEGHKKNKHFNHI